MAVEKNSSGRAAELLRKLSPKSRRSAIDYIEYLAELEELVLPEEEEALREDLAAAKAARATQYRHTKSLVATRQQAYR